MNFSASRPRQILDRADSHNHALDPNAAYRNLTDPAQDAQRRVPTNNLGNSRAPNCLSIAARVQLCQQQIVHPALVDASLCVCLANAEPCRLILFLRENTTRIEECQQA